MGELLLVGHSSECFSFIKDWVEKKVRRQLAHAQKRKGFGWERWSRQWLYDTLGLFNGYRVRRDRPPGITDATEGCPNGNCNAAAAIGTPWRAQAASMRATFVSISGVAGE